MATQIFCLIFTPDPCGNDPIWRAYFSKGVETINQKCCILLLEDPLDMENIPLFTRFYTSNSDGCLKFETINQLRRPRWLQRLWLLLRPPLLDGLWTSCQHRGGVGVALVVGCCYRFNPGGLNTGCNGENTLINMEEWNIHMEGWINLDHIFDGILGLIQNISICDMGSIQ